MRLPKILLIAFLTLLGVVILQVYLLKKWDSKVATIEKQEKPVVSSADRKQNLEEGVSLNNTNGVRVIGQFRSEIYKEQGYLKADVRVLDKDSILVFGPEDAPILTLLMKDIDFMPASQKWVGLGIEDLNSHIKVGSIFVSYFYLPVFDYNFPLRLDTSKLQKKHPKEAEYYKNNWQIIQEQVENLSLSGEFGVVSNLIIQE